MHEQMASNTNSNPDARNREIALVGVVLIVQGKYAFPLAAEIGAFQTTNLGVTFYHY